MEKIRGKLCYHFPWSAVKDELVPTLFRDFADHGAESLCIIDAWCIRMAEDSEFQKKLQEWGQNAGLLFTGSHAPWGRDFDLNIAPDLPQYGRVVDMHRDLLKKTADLGAKVYVCHVGNPVYGPGKGLADIPPLHDNARRMLEQLLPTAEKAGISLAIENGMAPTMDIPELRAYLKELSSPALGICFDTGHAHVVENPGHRLKGRYDSVFDGWFGDPPEYQNMCAELLEHIVAVHLHDNDGWRDTHSLPGDGTVNWETLFCQLASAPKLKDLEVEVNAIKHRVTISRLCGVCSSLFSKYLG